MAARVALAQPISFGCIGFRLPLEGGRASGAAQLTNLSARLHQTQLQTAPEGLLSGDLLAGDGQHRAYVMGRDGRRLILNLDRGSPSVRITLTHGAGAQFALAAPAAQACVRTSQRRFAQAATSLPWTNNTH